MSKVLILTYYWPPAGGPGVQRWLYFSRYLPDFGLEPVLYVPETPHYPLKDPGLQQLVPEGIKVYKSRFWEPYKLASLFGRKRTKRISSGIIRRENPGLLERFFLWIRGNFFIPDARKFWIKKALTELPDILEKEGITKVITTGPPHSLHLIGLALKQRHGVSWMADFRDPWTEIGYHDALRLGARARRRHEQLEKEVLDAADSVIATSRITTESFRKISGRSVSVITNGFDGSIGDGKQPEGPFVLAHIGSLLSGRNPESLWRAIAVLREEDPEFRKHFRLELTGLISSEIETALRTFGIWEHTTLKGYVSHEEAIKAQRAAQVLLLVEIDSPETRGIVPGKLFEYMAAARPVLAVGPEGWEAAQRLEEAGCGQGFSYEEQEAIATKLREWFALYRKGALEQDAGGSLPYRRRALTEQLATIIWEL